ncbi:MAG: universal stress protein [Anaerolineales bacterium]|jgi:nucleotide-binding universal stress UspA family protein
MDQELYSLSKAIDDFHKARSRAALEEILARLTGESTRLLSFDEVRRKLKVKGSYERGLHDIPLHAIVGSVGRYNDFTRNFLPKQADDESRWARVKVAASGLAGLDPIKVYQIGDTYFVKDGNHRVSVARQLGATHIQAYVTEVRTRVPLTPDVTPDDLILKAEYAEFLEKTRLDELCPNSDLSVTVPGQYPILLEHIEVHRHFMGPDFQRDIPYEKAVTHWYDKIYSPIVQIIRERGILRFFPNRTETDLYLWITKHRATLEKELGWEIKLEDAAVDLAVSYSEEPPPAGERITEKVLDALQMETLAAGPPPGRWRAERLKSHQAEHLFSEILVPVNGRPEGWHALDQAIIIAQREGAQIHGLHVVSTGEQRNNPKTLRIQQDFNARCAQANVEGRLVLAAGDVTQLICHRARWADLVVTNLAYPPAPQPLAKLGSGFRQLVQRCPRPLLATPQTVSPINRALLAYDGSPKAHEALFVATYLAGRWQISLTVITVSNNGHIGKSTLEEARRYLERYGVTAEYREEKGSVAGTILQVCREIQANLLIMGGYGYNPVLEIVIGSTVDQVLREARTPMLICR